MTGFLTFIGGFSAGLVVHSVVLLLFHRIDDDDWEKHRYYDED